MTCVHKLHCITVELNKVNGYHPELIILESPSLDVLLESLSVLLKSLHSREVNMDQHEIPSPQGWVGGKPVL